MKLMQSNKLEKKILTYFFNSLPNNKFFIESICRRQNKCTLKIEILFWMDRKHCGKRRKCWLPKSSSSGSFKVGMCGIGLSYVHFGVFDYIVEVDSKTLVHPFCELPLQASAPDSTTGMAEKSQVPIFPPALKVNISHLLDISSPRWPNG